MTENNNKHTVPTHRIHPIDIHIGKRIKQRSKELDVDMIMLAERTCISVGEINRIMEGKAKIYASQILEFTYVLHVSASFFFEKYCDDANRDIERMSRALLSISDLQERENFLQDLERKSNLKPKKQE